MNFTTVVGPRIFVSERTALVGHPRFDFAAEMRYVEDTFRPQPQVRGAGMPRLGAASLANRYRPCFQKGSHPGRGSARASPSPPWRARGATTTARRSAPTTGPHAPAARRSRSSQVRSPLRPRAGVVGLGSRRTSRLDGLVDLVDAARWGRRHASPLHNTGGVGRAPAERARAPQRLAWSRG